MNECIDVTNKAIEAVKEVDTNAKKQIEVVIDTLKEMSKPEPTNPNDNS